ncbi:MAG: hypothetical protein ACK46G_08540 [Flavobacteriales bacterium]|jgi:hypothetical protein
MNDLITIRAFRPEEDPESYNAYVEGHRSVLTEMGVLSVVKPGGLQEPPEGTVILVAEHNALGMVGGLRIERASSRHRLPIQQALVSLEPCIDEVIGDLTEDGCGEICGLWNTSRFAGRGVPLLLSEAAVSMVHHLGMRHLVCFVAHYTLRHALKVGFQLLDSLGDGGAFNYPIPRIKSFAMVIPDTVLLSTAPGNWRTRILSLRCRPFQDRIEAPTGIPYAVRYRLSTTVGAHYKPLYQHIALEKAAARA